MQYEEMIKVAEEYGFTKAAVIGTDELEFVHEFRMFCEQNACGNYGRNYGCPPYCGTPQEMEDKVMKYNKALVFQSRTPVEDIFDDGETKQIKKVHTGLTLQVVRELQKKGLDPVGSYVMCGPCNYCDSCKMSQGIPCVSEKNQFSCLSAYCIDACKMAKTCEMDMQWNGDVVSFFSLYLFDKNTH